VLIVRDLNIGILFFAAMASVVVSILASGGRQQQMLAAGRPAQRAQMISHELPLMALVAVAEAGTLSTVTGRTGTLVRTFGSSGCDLPHRATAGVNRVPFDLPEAEPLVAATPSTPACASRSSSWRVRGDVRDSRHGHDLFFGRWKAVCLRSCGS
jgi:hypothetical protein